MSYEPHEFDPESESETTEEEQSVHKPRGFCGLAPGSSKIKYNRSVLLSSDADVKTGADVCGMGTNSLRVWLKGQDKKVYIELCFLTWRATQQRQCVLSLCTEIHIHTSSTHSRLTTCTSSFHVTSARQAMCCTARGIDFEPLGNVTCVRRPLKNEGKHRQWHKKSE